MSSLDDPYGPSKGRATTQCSQPAGCWAACRPMATAGAGAVSTRDGGSEAATGSGRPAPAGASRRWRPSRTRDTATAGAGRTWARTVLPDLLPTAPDATLTAVVDLLLTELISNAVIHGGGMHEASIAARPAGVRVTVCDDSPVPPVVPDDFDLDGEHGRGMHLIAALAEQWGVQPRGCAGKCVWVDVCTDPRAGN